MLERVLVVLVIQLQCKDDWLTVVDRRNGLRRLTISPVTSVPPGFEEKMRIRAALEDGGKSRAHAGTVKE